MSLNPGITILKFGSSVLRSERDFPLSVHEVYRAWRHGSRVVAVVSALGSTTDDLLKRAEQLGLPPKPMALASLLATGEATAAALLALHLHRSGIPATNLDPAQAGLLTRGEPLDAEPVGLDRARILRELDRGVVVLPGFVGRDFAGRTTLLGRGGSDFTALYLAHELGGRCVLLKDVDGLYTADPNVPGSRARRYASLNWGTAIRAGGAVVQEKSLRFAEAVGLELTVTAPGAPAGTLIGPGPVRTVPPRPQPPPLRVALLGCGTVGGGVLERLLALRRFFEVVGVAVRDPRRERVPAVPRSLLNGDASELLDRPADVVVELVGGVDLPQRWIGRALAAGRHVVTANKALLANGIDALHGLAAGCGVRLLCSASVGGALPALETVRRAAAAGPVRSVSGVLNGTSNFVLEEIADGKSLRRAVAEAMRLGFAEADPTLDLDGTDAAQKLSLLAREAFGIPLDHHELERRGIERLDEETIAVLRSSDRTVRLVACCRRASRGLTGSVAPQVLPRDHPFARTRGAWNCLEVELESGVRITLSAQGAGRWPTTEAVLADLFDLVRLRSAGGAKHQVAGRETVEVAQ